MTDATGWEMLADSKLAGAAFRGLPKAAVVQPPGGFCFINCLGRDYATSPAEYTSVTFAVSRYCEHMETIKFEQAVTEAQAIRAAEKYLSEPLTEEHFLRIRDDLFASALCWAEAQLVFVCRGDCLTDARFLEIVEKSDGCLSLLTGS